MKRRLTEAGIALGVIMLIGMFVWPMVSRAVPTVSTNASLLGLLFLGMVASVSTCLASTGAFVLAYSSTNQQNTNLIKFHLGRLVAFAVGGAVLGALGSSLPGPMISYGILALILGVGFFMVGLHLLGLAPSLSSFGLRLPIRLNTVTEKLKNQSQRISFLVGAATFILPCGFTQTAQALALVSGSAPRGALLMLAFAFGTLPALIGISIFSAGKIVRHRFLQLATGAMLLIFSIGQLDGALTILGSPFTLAGSVRSAMVWLGEKTIPMANAREQVVTMTVAYGTFTPNRFVIRRGIPVLWQIEGVDIGGCASTIVAPTLNLSKNLELGANEIQFTPKTAGTIPFSCSMGMIRGSFQVID